jgi:hypothetical protein
MHGQFLEQRLHEFWIARGAILINNLTMFPWWLASVVEVAMLVPAAPTHGSPGSWTTCSCRLQMRPRFRPPTRYR